MKSFYLLTICFLAHFYFTNSVNGFKYEKCTKAKSMVDITSVTVSPDPISLSKDVTVSADISLHNDIPPDAMVKIKIYNVRSFLGRRIKLLAPCIKGLISCNSEPCELLSTYKKQACPFFPQGVECDCPVKAGHFRGENITIPIPHLNSFIKGYVSGEFYAKVKLVTKAKHTEKVLACYTFTGNTVP